MTPFWWFAAGFSAFAMLLLLAPLVMRRFREETDGSEEIASAFAIYRDQLLELERDEAAGRIAGNEARAARLEIERRILANDSRKPGATSGTPLSAAVLAIAAAIVPAASMAIYLSLGSPDTADQPLASRSTRAPLQQTADAGEMAASTENLARRLERDGGTAEEWWLLGQSWQMLERFDRAADAFRRVIEIDDGEPRVYGALGEALVRANGGQVMRDAEEAFRKVLDADPGDPRSRYYIGLAAAQNERFEDALKIWQDLYRDSPSDAPWLPTVRQGLIDMAGLLGRDPETIVPDPQPAELARAPLPPSAPSDPDALRARLEAEPKDFRGWLELARLEAARGDREAARTAIARVREVYAAAPFVLQQIARAEAELFDDGTASGMRGPTREEVAAAQDMSEEEQKEMIAGMVGGLAERLDENPDDLQGWIMLLRSYGVLGDRAAAEEAYERARTHFEDKADATALLERQARTMGLIRP
ncbi:MAG: c-type cytochrome biogenesis protein CcmI [Geminicoccaceae bacterium]